ncbi:hypothetical protein D3C71_2007110 [compost metagenome]
MVAHAGPGLGSQQIAARGLEELQHGLVFEGRRVRDIDHDADAGQRFVQPFAGDRVHAGRGRRGDGLMAALVEQFDEFGADQARAADDQDFHDGFLS